MNIGDLLAKAAVRFPNHTAVVFFKDTRLTTKELLERVYRLGNALLSMGLKKGDRVAVLLNNCHQSVECFTLSLDAGAGKRETWPTRSAGEVAGLIQEILPAKRIIANMVQEARDVLRGLADFLPE